MPLGGKVSATAVWVEVFARQAADPSNKWKNVKGPISAVCEVLGDLGWTAERPGLWIDPWGTCWADDPEPTDTRPVLDAIRASASQMYWGKAAEHHQGAGLEEGACCEQLRKTIRNLGARGNAEEANMLRAAVATAIWSPCRSQAAGLADPEP